MSTHPDWGGNSFFSSKQNNVNKNGKFYVIQSLVSGKKLSELNPFYLKKGFDNITTHIKDIIKQKDGSILLSTLNETGNKKIAKATKFIDIDIQVTEHSKLNNSQGIIYCRDLIGMDKDDIQNELKDQGICDVYIMNKLVNSVRKPNGLFILTFNSTSIPQYIKIGYTAIEVRTYIPNPLRCMICQAFGHSKNNCTTGNVLCGICSEELPHEICETKKCLNCKGAHESFSRKCPVYIEEAEIMRIKTIEKVSFSEARRRVKVKNNMNYAEALSNQNQIEHIQLKKDFLAMKKEIEEIKRNDLKQQTKIEQIIKEKNTAMKVADNLSKTVKNLEKQLKEQISENETLKSLLVGDSKKSKNKADRNLKNKSKKQKTYNSGESNDDDNSLEGIVDAEMSDCQGSLVLEDSLSSSNEMPSPLPSPRMPKLTPLRKFTQDNVEDLSHGSNSKTT